MSIPLVHHPDYYSDIGVHVFPTQKFALVLEGIRSQINDFDACVHVPSPAAREQLLRVHTADYLADLDACQRTARTISSELPLTRQIIDAYYLMAGGTCLAAELAVAHGCAMNMGGGFHHAFADRAEGFCYINDVAVAARDVQAQGRVERVAVIDTDLHQGNGTASIFHGDPSVFTFSIHQENLYPPKEESDLDIGLAEGTGDDEYLKRLSSGLDTVFDRFQPQFVLYVGGVDPYQKDLLGSLGLSKEGIRNRDTVVLRACHDRGWAVAAVLAGGYAADLRDTIEMHINTYLAMRDVFE
jgi:acetoin utilization deacetylase AcuC-like enzyme